MQATTFKIARVEDLDAIGRAVGLPVGPRTGPNKRTKEQKEWYVLLGFLEQAIPSSTFKLPIFVRRGCPNAEEPDFVVLRTEGTDPVALVEITEATDEADQREMTEHERSDKSTILLGELGGRFVDGWVQPGLVWAADIVDAIKRKDGKVIFRSAPVARHLVAYPNSNAEFMLDDEDEEREAVENLRAAIALDRDALQRMANGCTVHVLGKSIVCFDAMGAMTVVAKA